MLRALRQHLSIPEIDRYSDEQYERLIIQARIRRGDAIWVLPLAAGIVAAGAWAGASALIAMVLSKSFSSAALASQIGNFRWIGLNAAVMITLFLAAAIGLRWLMIVRSIRNILNRAGCPFCDFSLVGLKVEYGRVKCPECGSDVFLHEHRLNPDDLIPESQRHAPLPGAGPLGAYQVPPPVKSNRPPTAKTPSRR